MLFPLARPLSLLALVWFAGGNLAAQSVAKPPTTASKIEPGLELAVNWKWWVAPAERKEWGMPLPEALMPKSPGIPAATASPPAAERPDTYEVKKGDAIIKIAKKFGMSAAQLKLFNDMKDDRIRVGEVLRIPTLEELLTLAPPPPEVKKEVATKKKPDKPAGVVQGTNSRTCCNRCFSIGRCLLRGPSTASPARRS